MLDHGERLASARAAVDYITGRTRDEQQRPVPNCPGWTVYNAASHIGRVAIAWAEMIASAPDDPGSRERGYARSAQQPDGAPMSELAAWAHAALDKLDGDTKRRCYFSMTGGEGTVALWAWHAASELAVHRLDVEDALGHTHHLTDAQAIDAISYTTQYFLPAMRRVTGIDPGRVHASLHSAAGDRSAITIESDIPDAVSIEGPPTQILLAIWGRRHTDVDVTDGDRGIWDRWRKLPGTAFQFGTWD